VDLTFDSSAVFEVISVLAIIIVFVWRMPSKDDIQRLHDRIDNLEAKNNERFEKVDARFDKVDARLDNVDARLVKLDDKIDDTRKEAKADLARLEDRLATSNSYQAKSVELLDAIRRELEERREPL